MEYTLAVYTDTGIQKIGNQDSLCVRRACAPDGSEILLAAVCDGMGGLSKGELASAEAARALEAWFDSSLDLFVRCGGDYSELRRRLTDLIGRLDRHIFSYAQAAGGQMGSTLTALFAAGGRYLTVNVGDSRVYEIKNGLRQLTQDQSLVAAEIARGRLTPEEAKHHPQRNVLLQCIGAGRELKPEFTEGTVRSGAIYLLCSDGFVHELADGEISQSLSPVVLGSSRAMQDTLIELTERCKARGETDNITAVAVKTAESRLARPDAEGGLFSRLWNKKKAAPEPAPGPVLLDTAHILHTEERIPDRQDAAPAVSCEISEGETQ
jgi:serine/threonine protein phosphatase PrpC